MSCQGLGVHCGTLAICSAPQRSTASQLQARPPGERPSQQVPSIEMHRPSGTLRSGLLQQEKESINARKELRILLVGRTTGVGARALAQWVAQWVA